MSRSSLFTEDRYRGMAASVRGSYRPKADCAVRRSSRCGGMPYKSLYRIELSRMVASLGLACATQLILPSGISL